jgi:hypothetical protein
MFRNIFLCSMIILILMMAPSAYAGKVELTTYYPAPYGEYKELKSTEKADFATTSGSVTVGSATNLTTLAINDTLTLAPVTGAASVQTGGTAGSLRYSSDADGAGVGGMLYRDSSGWKTLGKGIVNSQVGSGSLVAERSATWGWATSDTYTNVSSNRWFSSPPSITVPPNTTYTVIVTAYAHWLWRSGASADVWAQTSINIDGDVVQNTSSRVLHSGGKNLAVSVTHIKQLSGGTSGSTYVIDGTARCEEPSSDVDLWKLALKYTVFEN